MQSAAVPLVALVAVLLAALAGCAAAATPYADFHAAATEYLEMDHTRVAAIGAAQLAGDRETAIRLAGDALAEYERFVSRFKAMTPAECYRAGHAGAVAAAEATLAVVRSWAGGDLPADADAEGFFRRYELKPQWKHTLDSAEVVCGG